MCSQAKKVLGSGLKILNDTTLSVPASEGGLNVTEAAHRGKIIEGISALERSDPSDSTDSGLYLPLMLAGCTFFVYVMFIKDTHLERNFKSWARKMGKKVKAREEGGAMGAGNDDDWLVGTSASAGGVKKRPHKKK